MNEFWIILTGILTAVSCALVGSFLVLRKNAMLGDAISHSVLPGLVLAFLISGSRSVFPMLFGAAFFGLLTAFLTESLHRYGKVQQDASIGVIFTWLFALGVILVSLYTGQVDLDQECVLYGEIAYVPWDVWLVGDTSWGPRAIWMIGSVLICDFFFIFLFFKELKITTFDPLLADSLGISTRRYHYLLMTFVSLTTVASFESVGAILVVAMLVAPAAAAYLLTDSLKWLLIIASLIGSASAVFGYLLATLVNGSIAGCMAVMAGFFFLMAFLFSPLHGLIRRRITK